MRIKTSDLIGPALNWAVLTALGYTIWDGDWYADPADHGCRYKTARYARSIAVVCADGTPYHPSTDWSQGGPIIEQNDISFRKYHNPKSEAHGTYYARVCQDSGTLIGWYKTTGFQQTGPTPLIAAMRCLVASKLGDEVEIPDELGG